MSNHEGPCCESCLEDRANGDADDLDEMGMCCCYDTYDPDPEAYDPFRDADEPT